MAGIEKERIYLQIVLGEVKSAVERSTPGNCLPATGEYQVGEKTATGKDVLICLKKLHENYRAKCMI
jgi:hypothetical protein